MLIEDIQASENYRYNVDELYNERVECNGEVAQKKNNCVKKNNLDLCQEGQ